MASAEEPRTSVYQRVLGADFGDLDPRLQRYFSSPPAGMVGVGRGVYDVAGSRRRWLRPLLSWLAWRRILFPEFGRGVPFTVVNTPDAAGTLSAIRTFAFPRRERRMEDTMAVVGGRLVDRLGRRRGLEVDLRLAVVDGGLRMTSGAVRLRLGGIRMPLPRVATLALQERTDTVDPARQRVDVTIVSPFVGEVFRYAGTFTYSYMPVG